MNIKKSLEKLLKEIDYNNKKVQEKEFLKNLDQFKEALKHTDRDEIAWLPKAESFFGMSKFDAPLQYLPSIAYYNFMNQGFFTNINEIRVYPLIRLYSVYIYFSWHSQEIEDRTHNHELSDDEGCEQLQRLYYDHKNRFEDRYRQFNPDNRIGLEIKYWWNLF